MTGRITVSVPAFALALSLLAPALWPAEAHAQETESTPSGSAVAATPEWGPVDRLGTISIPAFGATLLGDPEPSLMQFPWFETSDRPERISLWSRVDDRPPLTVAWPFADGLATVGGDAHCAVERDAGVRLHGLVERCAERTETGTTRSVAVWFELDGEPVAERSVVTEHWQGGCMESGSSQFGDEVQQTVEVVCADGVASRAELTEFDASGQPSAGMMTRGVQADGSFEDQHDGRRCQYAFEAGALTHVSCVGDGQDIDVVITRTPGEWRAEVTVQRCDCVAAERVVTAELHDGRVLSQTVTRDGERVLRAEFSYGDDAP